MLSATGAAVSHWYLIGGVLKAGDGSTAGRRLCPPRPKWVVLGIYSTSRMFTRGTAAYVCHHETDLVLHPRLQKIKNGTWR